MKISVLILFESDYIVYQGIFHFFSFLFKEAFGSPTARHDNDDPIAAESCEETEAGKYRIIL